MTWYKATAYYSDQGLPYKAAESPSLVIYDGTEKEEADTAVACVVMTGISVLVQSDYAPDGKLTYQLRCVVPPSKISYIKIEKYTSVLEVPK